MSRMAARSRATKETSIDVTIDLDGTGLTDVSTGIPFFDHMLDQLGRHSGFDLRVEAVGD
ncbi:MAG: hisB, partial [Desertimonas sp.]|nr:hisB [Desertimonas sp.]